MVLTPTSYYQSIAERNEDIAVEYIVKNQAEFYNSLEDFSMTKNVLERLLFEQKIPMDNREELFEKYAKTYMTEKIALNIDHSVLQNIFPYHLHSAVQD